MTNAIVPVSPLSEIANISNSDLLALQRTVFHATRAEPRPIKSLMPWILDRRNLGAAFERVSGSDGADSPGPDGVTCHQLRHRVGPWLAELADALYRQAYHPGAPRWIDIPKPDKPGQFRRIGILNVRDRVVQAAIKQVLEPILEPAFAPMSFGFRPGRSVAGALDAAVRLLSAPAGESPRVLWAIPVDVADCFPTIDHEHLKACLHEHVGDPEVKQLLARIIASGGTVTGRLWWQRLHGIVQGGALSPLLCNLALHPLDIAAARLGQETAGGVVMLRYADDLLILAREANLATRAVALLRGVLNKQHQKFKPEPSSRTVKTGIEWLGVVLRPRALVRQGSTEFGYQVPEAKIQSMLRRLEEMTNPPSDKIDAAAFNLGRWIVSVNDQLRDWRAAYLFADNGPELFRLLDDVARDRVGHLIKAVTGANWGEVRRSHYARLPRGFWTWEAPGARLSVLSSLAPHAPARLTRRPPWWSEMPSAPAGGNVEG
jgi:group II intron reverse transcriptase/maturase